jgi:anti-sigma B factor antagonist
VAVVALRGEQDSYSALRLDEELDQLLERGSGVAVDLRKTTFVDSTTLGTLLGARAKADEAGLGFVLVLPSDDGAQVHRILELTNLESAFEIYDQLERGIAAARGSVRPTP